VRLDVLLGESLPTPADVAGRMVVVIDVLRASTVMVDALAAADVMDDVAVCLVFDRAPVLAAYSDRQVTGERIVAAA
jgi:phosphosulfolactate phosphohydrolase-like enzyme